ncbi:coiled-coil domain-containing protein 93 isoform X1 [Quercus lobata]|uniref:coiled-coil domain-containing protein 93 isoform X1 n=2 Tax=Quercus lobata TaxID=97700 RepID=UPI0012486F8E|nr:coiled-coil domain-containing protein 93 isoform X1 [Quercus lobata]
MAEFQSESTSSLDPILDLLLSVGYADARKTDISASKRLSGGLAWCVAAVNSDGPRFDEVPDDETLTQQEEIEIGKQGIEESLRSMGCPHSLEAYQIETLDCNAIFPVVQWLVYRIRLSLSDDENQQELNVMNQLKLLRERIDKEGASIAVQKLISLMESLKVCRLSVQFVQHLERQESEFQLNCNVTRLELQAEVIELEGRIASGCDSKSLSHSLNQSFIEPLEKLNSAKRELAARYRAIVAVKRQLDDVPSQSELIQYERRFSELYVHIQEKLRQTRKCYGTYNALLEIKELMLKETSLLNSISSQFQDAITSTAGRMKLIDSMEGIVKSSQQKLDKVQLGLLEEQKVCDALKQRYAVAVAEQRHCYSLLKAFQEECALNEKLRCQTSV